MVTLEPKPGPASLALTSWVPAPVPLPVGPVPRVPMPVGPERSVPMPVGPVRQDTGSTGFQWQASSDKLSKSLEKTMSGNSEKIAIDDWMPSGLDEFVKLHLHHACATGFLLQDEQSALQQTLPLQGLNPEEQRLVTQKFLSPSYDEFRSIVNKWSWLQRCMEYCGSSSKKSERIVAGSPQERLLLALNEHALRESALSDECWTTFEMVHPPLQDMVVQAVAASLPMKTAEDLSQHFVHLALNEESIYNLEAREKEQPIVTRILGSLQR